MNSNWSGLIDQDKYPVMNRIVERIRDKFRVVKRIPGTPTLVLRFGSVVRTWVSRPARTRNWSTRVRESGTRRS